MKKLMITVTAAAATLVVNAATAKYGDVYGVNASNVLAKAGVSVDTEASFADMKILKSVGIDPRAVTKFQNEPEFDAFVLKFAQENYDAKNAGSWNDPFVWLKPAISKKVMPKTFAFFLASEKNPDLQIAYDRAGFFDIKKIGASDAIRILNAGNMTTKQIDDLNEAIKNAGVRPVKVWYRKSGKTFVAKKDAKNKVIYNPLQAPMKELTDSLNAAKYEGLNAWIEKYGADWEKVNLTWLPNDADLNALKEKILVDEDTITANTKVLRVALGVDGFNAFVKEYNEGVTK